MNFKHDILLIDLEMTGLDPKKNEIIEIAAIILNKKTLKEKRSFQSYLKPQKWKNRDLASMKVNKINFDSLKNAPTAGTVLKKFIKFASPASHVLAYYGGPLDIDFLKVAFEKNKISWKFDYHFFNLWPLFFTFLAKQNLLKNSKKFNGFALEDLMKKFDIRSEKRHSALEDCRIESTIFKKILYEGGFL